MKETCERKDENRCQVEVDAGELLCRMWQQWVTILFIPCPDPCLFPASNLHGEGKKRMRKKERIDF